MLRFCMHHVSFWRLRYIVCWCTQHMPVFTVEIQTYMIGGSRSLRFSALPILLLSCTSCWHASLHTHVRIRSLSFCGFDSHTNTRRETQTHTLSIIYICSRHKPETVLPCITITKITTNIKRFWVLWIYTQCETKPTHFCISEYFCISSYLLTHSASFCTASIIENNT